MRIATRTLIVVGISAWIVLIVVTLVDGPYSGLWWVALALFFVTWILTRVLSQDIAEKQSANLDEYEDRLRSQARSIGYRIAILGGILLFIALSIFAVRGRQGDSTLLLNSPGLILAYVLAVSITPTYILAWNTRHEVKKDSE